MPGCVGLLGILRWAIRWHSLHLRTLFLLPSLYRGRAGSVELAPSCSTYTGTPGWRWLRAPGCTTAEVEEKERQGEEGKGGLQPAGSWEAKCTAMWLSSERSTSLWEGLGRWKRSSFSAAQWIMQKASFCAACTPCLLLWFFFFLSEFGINPALQERRDWAVRSQRGSQNEKAYLLLLG